MKEKIKNADISHKNKSKVNLELDKCLTASHPEMARNTDEDEPCDDNRS